MDNSNTANIGAKLEVHFGDIAELNAKTPLDGYGLEGFTLVSVGQYKRGENETYPGTEYPKAITVRDKYGNIYVHFNGTGDGNWGYNSVAYGGPPSPMQEWALSYFNETVEKHYEGQSAGDLYVAGHSQGGNNAQFVTIRSQYGDYISTCITLDGPGFSEEFVSDSIDLYGEAFFERQRNKIWAYNGENDFVSCLGQVSIVPDGHTQYLQYTNPNNKDVDFMMFHAANGLLDSNGNIILVDDDSAFRKYVVETLEKIKQLPPEQQKRAADIVMAFCENSLSNSDVKNMLSDISSEDFELLKEILIPLIVDILADDPEKISPMLQELGIDKPAADAITNLIKHFDSYPPEVREQILQAIFQIIKYEDGQFSYDLSKIPGAIIAAWPVILETILTHPGDIGTILHELGVDKAIENWIKENPWKFAGVCIGLAILAPIIVPIIKVITVVGILMDAIIRIIQGINWLGAKIKETLIQLFNSIKNAIKAFAKWISEWRNRAGRAYAATHPYFAVDTTKLRNYAARINNVNTRLRNLDHELNGLYWQVGLLDFWDILVANLLTGGSPTLNQIKAYLNEAADRFEAAENKARGYM
jgi:hypothetical protein